MGLCDHVLVEEECNATSATSPELRNAALNGDLSQS